MFAWILSILGICVGAMIIVLVAGGLAFTLLGRRVPEEHEAVGAIDVKVSIDEAFAVIDNVQEHPSWNGDVQRVEPLPDRNGMPACRMHMGRHSVVLVRTKYDPPRELERTISDERGPFSGTWSYHLSPRAEGCEVRLREVGRVRSAIPRAMMKYIFGYHMFLNRHLRALGRRLGSTSEPRKL